MAKGVTTFEIDETTKGIVVSQLLNKKAVKQTYAVSMDDAEWIRGIWVDQFWGFSQNVEMNKVCCS